MSNLPRLAETKAIRGLREGDLVHCKGTGDYNHDEIYRVINVYLRARDYKWVADVVVIRPNIKQFANRPFTFPFENIKRVSPLIQLALQANDD